MKIPDVYGQQKRVVIIGAGFAGIALGKRLPGKYFQVVLLERNNYHQFQPLLYQVATSALEPSSISFPLRRIFGKKKHVFVRMTEVKGIVHNQRMIHTTSGDLAYDYLVLAHGVVTNYFQNESMAHKAYAMKSVSDALLLRNVLLQKYERVVADQNSVFDASLLNVVIVGGGPTGVELAGAIAEMKKHALPSDYRELDFRKMHIYLVEAAPRLLNGMSAGAGNTAKIYLEKLGVEIKTHTAVSSYDGETVLLSNGLRLMSRCVIWTAGVKGASMPGIPETVITSGNRILVNRYHEVKDIQGVYAIGDICLMKTPNYPKGHPQVAPAAIQQARHLAAHLTELQTGKTTAPFEYKDKGSLATVGRNLALAEFGHFTLKGFVAWFIWMAVHLLSIIGIKNRLLILINWGWQYITRNQSLRLIIQPSENKNDYEKKTIDREICHSIQPSGMEALN